MEVPEIRYARSGDVSVAYQSFGSGEIDLVVVRGSLSELSSVWDQTLFVRHAEGLASFARVLMFDKRGMGLSDRIREVPTLDTRMDDIRAVMDDAGVDRAVAVHTAARIASLAEAGEVLVSGTVRDLVAGSLLEFTDRGSQTLKGVPGSWPVYAVAS